MGGRVGDPGSTDTKKRSISSVVAPLPQPRKEAKFASTADYNYCADVNTLLGPGRKVYEHDILLKVLGIGPHLFGYDKVDFALPMTHKVIKKLAKVMRQENNWKFPRKHNSTPIQTEYRRQTESGWKSWLKTKLATRNANNIYGDVSKKATVEWFRISIKLNFALDFFRDVWICNPDLSRDDAFHLAMSLIKRHIKTPAGPRQRKRFFDQYISEIRFDLARRMMDELHNVLLLGPQSCQFENLLKACENIREILGHLGLETEGSARQCFDQLQAWHSQLRPNQQEIITEYSWISKLHLQELPQERIERLKAAEQEPAVDSTPTTVGHRNPLSPVTATANTSTATLNAPTANASSTSDAKSENVNIAPTPVLSSAEAAANTSTSALNESTVNASSTSDAKSENANMEPTPALSSAEAAANTYTAAQNEPTVNAWSAADATSANANVAPTPALSSAEAATNTSTATLNEPIPDESSVSDAISEYANIEPTPALSSAEAAANTSASTENGPATTPDDAKSSAAEMVDASFVDIIEVTVDDMREYEKNVDARQDGMAATVTRGDFPQQAPKLLPNFSGSRIEFTKPSHLWKEAMVWQFLQIQALVNLLTTDYGIVPLKMHFPQIETDRAVQCAVTCGFFLPGDCETNAHICAHVKEWLPALQRTSFIPYMATLQSIFGRTVHPQHNDSVLREWYKLAKSALVHRFSNAGASSLQRIINALVKQGSQPVPT